LSTLRHFLRFAVEHYLVLPAGGLLAIVWANTAPNSYFETAQALAFWVNEVGMALVFAYFAQEAIEAAMPGGTLHPGGALHPWRSAVGPVLAGIGGIAGAVALYLGYIRAGDEAMLEQGWPIVCAVDLLFSVAIARWVFMRTAPATFLLVVALTSDIVGLTIVSPQYVSSEYPVALPNPAAGLLIIPALAVCAALRYFGTRSIWPYLVLAGPLSWVAFSSANIHPALALLPIVPFLSHTARDLTGQTPGDPGPHASRTHLEHVLRYPVQAIAFLFALVNAGVLIHGFDTGSWAVLLAALVGRPLGILAIVGLAVVAGLRLPRVIGWRELVVIALAAAPGLIFGLFLATAIFPTGPLLVQTKIGALLTAAGAIPALLAARLLHVGRFGSLAADRPHVKPIDAPLTRGHA
jgi:Na+:H+ antiporter, NhaA family